jgi:hypothetical protein
MKKNTLFTLLFALIGLAVMSVSKATPIEKDKSEIVAKVAKDAPAVAAFEITSVNYSDNSSPVILKAVKGVPCGGDAGPENFLPVTLAILGQSQK